MKQGARHRRWLSLAIGGFFVAVLVARPTPLPLFGADAACYARIARDLAERQVSTWADVRWEGQPFREHPPLALWLEALWFRAWGASSTSAVWLARTWAAMLGGMLLLLDRSRRVWPLGTLGVLMLALSTAFVAESQNPMLEGPLTVAFGAALWAAVELSNARWAWVGFALATWAAFWVKGVVALALLGLLPWAIWQKAPLGRVVTALVATVGLMVASAWLFDAWCHSLGVEGLWRPYFVRQLMPSMMSGRGNPEAPWFYLVVLRDWHLLLLAALPFAVRGLGRAAMRWRRIVTASLWLMTLIVLGFSAPAQKNVWYLSPMLVPEALVGGAVIWRGLRAGRRHPKLRALLTAPRLAVLVSLGAIGFATFQFTSVSFDTPRRSAIRAISSLAFDAHGMRVRNCTPLSDWVAKHLFAFEWNALAVGCDDDGAFRFDGQQLEPKP